MNNLSYIKKDKSALGLEAVRVLATSSRYSIMALLLNSKEELCVNQIAKQVGMSQSATSHQLAYLEVRGIIRGIRYGQTKCYVPTNSILTKKIALIIKALT